MKKNVALTCSNKLQQVTEKEVTKTASSSTNYTSNAGMTRVEEEIQKYVKRPA